MPLIIQVTNSGCSTGNNISHPNNLRIDRYNNPNIAIPNNTEPKFSWNNPKTIHPQTHYQIEITNASRDLIFDSEKLTGNKHVNIIVDYPFSPNATFYWRVRTFSHKTQSTFSPYQKFEFTTNKEAAELNLLQLIKSKTELGNISKIGPTQYAITFPTTMFGYPTLNIATDKPGTAEVVLTEYLKDGEIPEAMPGTARKTNLVIDISPQDQLYSPALPNRTENIIGSALDFTPDDVEVTPFKYATVTLNTHEASLTSFSRNSFHHQFDDSSSYFLSNNAQLNQLWELSKHTIKATSFMGIYIDGDRERTPYEADAYINLLSHLAVDSSFNMGKRTLEYLFEHPTWPTEWISISILMTLDYYTHSKDLDFLKENYNLLKKRSLLNLKQENFLVSTESKTLEDLYHIGYGEAATIHHLTDIVDWPPGERDNYEFGTFNTTTNSFYIAGLKALAAIANIIGDPKDEKLFENEAREATKALNSLLYNDSTGLYVDSIGSSHSSIHANIYPLFFDLAPKESIQPLVSYIKEQGMQCSIYCSYYLLHSLINHSEAREAIELMLNPNTDRSWYHIMHNLKAGITPEAWDFKYKPNMDLNHAWGASPATLIANEICGVKLSNDNEIDFIISPKIESLAHANCKVPSIHGSTTVEWNNEQDTLLIEIPPNTKASICIDNVCETLTEQNYSKTIANRN